MRAVPYAFEMLRLSYCFEINILGTGGYAGAGGNPHAFPSAIATETTRTQSFFLQRNVLPYSVNKIELGDPMLGNTGLQYH